MFLLFVEQKRIEISKTRAWIDDTQKWNFSWKI